MATSVLDVRDTFALPRVRIPSWVAVRTSSRSRLPLTVLAACVIGVLESVALLGAALTVLDGVMASPDRPSGAAVTAGLVVLAGWVVLAAGTGAALVDGTGRRLLVALAWIELAAVGLAAVVRPLPLELPEQLSPVALLLVAVPVAKLLLAGSASARAWVAAGPRPRERRPDPVARHRLVCTLTVAAIGLGLGAVAVAGPPPGQPGGAGTAMTSVAVDR
ncbi:hypothetical protein OF117_09375 [Geodermatophilus sp. YIM 151500]|uniref:hypothetical protein n=1 Tax=Geodermatophilus sp. YIM 151500 TaxID=2984531 RepID=UPI0021E4DD83|nr:hypothetical protein [Geodermatophilus sp. YIM 151500]MCV2489576.1 hypothetical protein [Geodermatophilus sp. YIM 151500]